MALTWRIGNGVWAVLLILGALVQLNDPDPFVWVAVYLCASALSAAAAAGRLAWWPPAALAVAAVAWAALIAAGGIDESNPMKGPGGLFESGPLAEEVVREGLGLLLIALGAATQAVVARRAAG